MGVVPPLENFLQELRKITEDNGSLLIFDEVMTGFRVGYHCAQGYFGVTPDLTCLGKVIGGGLPVGAFGGKREIMENIAPTGTIYHTGTLSGNPLAMTAGYETLSQMDENAYELLNQKIDRLIEGYKQAAIDFAIPLHINRAGSMVGVFFTNQPVINFETAKSANLDYFAQYYRAMIEEGIFLPPSQFEGLFLSTAHTDEDVDKTIQAVRNSFSKIEK
jgi:glutamate-1-semialdehyde 2,1-aminomutase